MLQNQGNITRPGGIIREHGLIHLLLVLKDAIKSVEGCVAFTLSRISATGFKPTHV